MFANHLYAFHNVLTPEGEPTQTAEEFLKEWTPTTSGSMVYDQSDTDMLVAMPLPLTDLFRDGLSPWETCAELATRDPDRTVFWGSVNPLEGRRALDLMERQVGEFGAKAFKFYNVRYDYGSPFPWRMDDPQDRLPGLREGPGTGDQPDRRAQGRAAGPAAGRGHPDLGHGRRGGRLPRHQLRDLPRRAAVHRRDLLAADPLPEPLRLAGGDRSTSSSGRRGCSPRSSASCCSGAARTRSSTAPRRRSGSRSGRCRPSRTSRSRRTSATATAIRSSPTSPSARSSARTCCGCTAWTSRRPRRAWAARRPTDTAASRAPPRACAGLGRAAPPVRRCRHGDRETCRPVAPRGGHLRLGEEQAPAQVGAADVGGPQVGAEQVRRRRGRRPRRSAPIR